jgi:hypothetical protein
MVRALAIVLAAVAAGCMAVAIVGMVTGRPGGRTGYVLRGVAVVCFGGAVALASSAR